MKILVKMDQPLAPQLDDVGISIKRKRSQTSRRPRPEAQPEAQVQPLLEQSSDPFTPVSDVINKVSSDANTGGGNSGGKMFNLNQCVMRSSPASGLGSGSNAVDNGISDGSKSQNKVKKVKFKVGGVTRTIHAQSSANGTSVDDNVSSIKACKSADYAKPRQRLTGQEIPDDYYSPTYDKKRGLQGIPRKDFSEDIGRTSGQNVLEKREDRSDSVRKSKRVPKRRALDTDFDDDDEDDEIRYLEKLKSSRIAGYREFEVQANTKLHKGGKCDNSEDVRRHIQEALTSRQRALLTKDTPKPGGASGIEFPNGLPPAPPRKQKEKLTEVEQQLKKAEASQRRRMQNEKASRESEAEAIRKILGQDSSRKKREEKIKKRQEELAQEKAAHTLMLASNTIRMVMGPTGTTVTFPQEMGLPKMFDSKIRSYPPPREKCVGPLCTNDYKYRDSRLKLPLCSLECYKAVDEEINTQRAC